MATRSKNSLRQSALASGLVSKPQLEHAIAQAQNPPHGPPAPRVEVTDDQLARQLIAMGLLTPYQADQLKAGLTKLTLGPYVITDFIAQGGMGQVFKAEHRLMGREVAIKVLPGSRSTPSAIENFMREIRTQAVLDHDNLVRAYDAGHDGKVYYLVTEYVKGLDLRRLVRSQGPLDPQHASSIILQAARGLQSAHEKGLIHRDIKPGNILVTRDGKAKVSDLGLAGFFREGSRDPRSGKIVGTADYISPEQIRSPESITAASDIYSLGCTLYYTVTGKVPFPGGSTRDKARRHCEETPWHPRRFSPNVTEDFVDIIADMMEKNPERRVRTAQEVVVRLEPWACDLIPFESRHTRSPWTPPPVPGDLPADDEDLQITEDATSDDLAHDRSGGSSMGQGSQSTERAAGQDTHNSGSSQRFPGLPADPSEPPVALSNQPLFLALAIAIPVSMLIGALLALVFVLLT